MAVSFSERQQQAISWDSNKELLVSAAAGSGKTTVLTARIIDRIVNKNVDVDKFLVVTYTHMAADDLKERITKALTQAVREDPDNIRLHLQLASIPSANIGTMHAFCLKVLKEYHEHPNVNLPKSVKILSEDKGKDLLREAVDEVFTDEYASEDRSSFERLLNTYASFKNDIAVREYVTSLYKFALNNVDPYQWLDDMARPDGKKQYEADVYDFFAVMAREMASLCIQTAERYVAQTKSKADFGLMLQEVAALAIKFSDLVADGRYVEADTVVQDMNDIIVLRGGSPKDEAVKAQKTVLKFVKDRFIKEVKLVCDDTSGKDTSMHEVIAALFDLATKVGRRFEEKKRKAKCIDYSDMEHLVLKLFEDESVAGIFASRFEHIMFDEYQDCNRLQEMIVQKISSNARYFMVGDIKQSIYSFRQAEPKLFLDKYKAYEYKEDAKYALIELNENYRSRQNVLNGVNRVFFNIMREDYCGMQYNSLNALNAMASYPEAENSFGDTSVKLDIVTGKGLDKDEKCYAQLVCIIDRIRDMVANKTVYDPGLKAYRKMRYSDIAILMRSPKNEIPYIRSSFAMTDIPVDIMQDADIKYSLEINLLICLLRTVENPYNDIALMTVLHSYIFGVDDTELAELMNFGGQRGDLLTRVGMYIEQGQDAVLKTKLEGFIKRLGAWTENEKYMSVADFIDDLLDEVAYREYFSVGAEGKKRLDNIDLLCSMLKSGSDSSVGGIYECIRIINSIEENGLNGNNSSAVSDAVKVMSMHKSKGLEFPVVFLMDIQSSFSSQDRRSTVLMHKDYGAVSEYIDTDIRMQYKSRDHELMKYLLKKSQAEEEQRILYVAMTRAKEELVLVGCTTADDVEKNGYIGKTLTDVACGGCYLDWVIYSLCCGNNDFINPITPLMLKGGVLKLFADGVSLYPSQWSVDVLEVTPTARGVVCDNGRGRRLVESNVFRPVVGYRCDEEGSNDEKRFAVDADEIIKKLEYVYPYESATRLSSKLSVTQIKQLRDAPEESDAIPDYRYDKVKVISSDPTMSSVRLGSLYHFFMQHATPVYPYTFEIFKKDIKRMLDNKLITQKESGMIRSDRVMPFYNSAIGQRAAAARRLEREKSFSLLVPAGEIFDDVGEGDKILVQGVIDCLFEDADGRRVLVDYKTDAVAPEEAQSLAEKHAQQVALYKRAIEEIEGVSIDETYIYSFALNEFIKVNC